MQANSLPTQLSGKPQYLPGLPVIKKYFTPLNAQDLQSVWLHVIFYTLNRTQNGSFPVVSELRLNSSSKDERCQGLQRLRTAARHNPTPPLACSRANWKNATGSSVVHAQPTYSTAACPSFPRGRLGIAAHSEPSEGASESIVHTRKLLEGKIGTP